MHNLTGIVILPARGNPGADCNGCGVRYLHKQGYNIIVNLAIWIATRR
jgi:hypothetical protein